MDIKEDHIGNSFNAEQSHSNGFDEPSYNPAIDGLVSRLKIAIEEKSKFAEELNLLAAGYAGGARTDVHSAKREIQSHFKQKEGVYPNEYLQRQFEERKQNSNNYSHSQSDGLSR